MAQVTGITQNACKAIVNALNNYEKNLRSNVGYGVGVNDFVKGDNARKALYNLVNVMMNDFREEIAVQIASIEKIAGTLESNYAKIDSQTTFTKS